MHGLTNTGALFFRRQMGTRDVYEVDIDPVTLALGSEPRRVSTEGVGANGSSAWSPDGARLAFFRRRVDMQPSLIVKSMDDGKEQEFWKPHLDGISRPRWERDGQSLLFKAWLNRRPGLFRLDIQSGDVTTVMDRFFNEYELLPQPGTIVYAVRSSREVIRRDLVTGQERVLHRVPPPSTLVEMGLSNRGDQLAYSAPLGGGKGWALRVIALGSPERAREILRVGPDEFIGAYAWSLDDREVIIKRARNVVNPAPDERRESDDSRLWAVSAMTGQSRLIGLHFDGLQQVRTSPDGRRLSFDGGWPLQEVWALEHALAGVVR
jgi:Tol biopolymer transport system component